jgi:hypothetical protein
MPGEAVCINYREPRADAPAVLGRVRDWQRELCARHVGLCARLYARPEDADSASRMLMETYTFDNGAVATALHDTLSAGPPAYTASAHERHVEAFTECAW